MKILIYLFFIVCFLSFSAYAQITPSQTLTVTVLDENNKPIKNLPESAFTIYVDKEPRKIISLKVAENPASVGFLVDLSFSVSGEDKEAINLVRHGIFEFFKLSNPKNDYFLMGFNEQTKLASDWTNNQDEIVEGLNKLPSMKTKCLYECSRVYDAWFEAIEKLKTGKNSKKILILFSDAWDDESKHSEKELKRQVQENDTLNYLLLTPSINSRTDLYLSKMTFIERLIDFSGGKILFAPNPFGGMKQELFEKWKIRYLELFNELAAILNSHYEITIESAQNVVAPKSQKINIKVKLPADLKKRAGKIQVLYRSET